LGLRKNTLHFRHRDDRQKADEEQKEGEKEAERAGENAHIHPGGLVVAPGARQEITRQGGDDDDEALEPHAEVDQQCGNKHHRD